MTYREPLTKWEEDMQLAGMRKVTDHRGTYWVGPAVYVSRHDIWRGHEARPGWWQRAGQWLRRVFG
jgi:hypothetical protein